MALRGRLPRHGRHRRAGRHVRRGRAGALRDRADGTPEPGHSGCSRSARHPGLGDHWSAGDPRLRRERPHRRHSPRLRRAGPRGNAVAPRDGDRAAPAHPGRRLPRTDRRPGPGSTRASPIPPRHRRARPRRRADHPGPGHCTRGRPRRPPRRAHTRAAAELARPAAHAATVEGGRQGLGRHRLPPAGEPARPARRPPARTRARYRPAALALVPGTEHRNAGHGPLAVGHEGDGPRSRSPRSRRVGRGHTTEGTGPRDCGLEDIDRRGDRDPRRRHGRGDWPRESGSLGGGRPERRDRASDARSARSGP